MAFRSFWSESKYKYSLIWIKFISVCVFYGIWEETGVKRDEYPEE